MVHFFSAICSLYNAAPVSGLFVLFSKKPIRARHIICA